MNFASTEDTIKTHITAEEKPVYMTTFKSVKTEDGSSVIASEHTRVTEADTGVLIEEALSDVESTGEGRESPSYKVEIIEVSDIAGDFIETHIYCFF